MWRPGEGGGAPLRGNVEPELTAEECECEGISESRNRKKLKVKRGDEVEINFKINFELIPGAGNSVGGETI